MKYIVLSYLFSFAIGACASRGWRDAVLQEPLLGIKISPEIAYPKNPPAQLCNDLKIVCNASFLVAHQKQNGITYFLVVRIHGVYLDDGNNVPDGWTVDEGLVVSRHKSGKFKLISNSFVSLGDGSVDSKIAVGLYKSAFAQLKKTVGAATLVKAIQTIRPTCSENLGLATASINLTGVKCIQ